MEARIAGKQVVDISGLLSRFEAQEGEVQQIIGKTGNGKTYEATRRALNYLYAGYTVYTTWRLNLPEYYDEREDWKKIIWKTLTFNKDFYRFNLRENWNYVDLKQYEVEGIVDTEALARFLATRTDCIFMLDEGQDVFDSAKRSGQITRQSITRTRHMHKTLIIISQRPHTVDVNARANVTWFYQCIKVKFPFFPPLFRVYRTDEIDEHSNYPIWARHDATGRVTWRAKVWHSAFAKKYIYDAYDSWFMRQNMIRSQDIKLNAYHLTLFDKVYNLSRLIFRKKPKKEPKNKAKKDIPISTELSPTVAPAPVRARRVKVQ